MKDFKDYKNKKEQAEILRTIYEEYHKRIADSYIDKYKMEIQIRDNSPLKFECHIGRYGDSAVYSFKSVNQSKFRHYLEKWLNKNLSKVLSEVSDLIDEDSEEEKQEYRAYLEKELKNI